mmetsp:Transcript_38066/g.78099  ORF Transcript_38066/g.78099 Transcript_38066/m.78099 type:complete len:358 (+) Transcript_38066:871-1944(+)
MQAVRPFCSSIWSSFRPMNTIRTTFSPAFHGSSVGPNSICSCTPWKTNFMSLPLNLRTPLERKRSSFLVWMRFDMNWLNFASSSSSSASIPTELTPEMCAERLTFFFWGSASSCPCACPAPSPHPASLQPPCSCEWEWEWPCAWASSEEEGGGSSSSSSSSCSRRWLTLSRLKEPMPSSWSRSTRLRSHSKMLARPLIDRNVFRTADFSSAVTRSILFSKILSANATWLTASLTTPASRTSSRCCLMFLASTTQRMASILNAAPHSGLLLKVKATGAGSAIPVVSMITASYFSSLAARVVKAFTRSPRTVQQTHPLSIEMTSSLACKLVVTRLLSMSIAPNSFSTTAIFFPCRSVRM